MKQGEMQYVHHCFSLLDRRLFRYVILSHPLLLQWHNHTTLENWRHLQFVSTNTLLIITCGCVYVRAGELKRHYVSNKARGLDRQTTTPTPLQRQNHGLHPTLSAAFEELTFTPTA